MSHLRPADGLASAAVAIALAIMVLLASPITSAHAQEAPALANLSSILAIHGNGQPDTLILFAELPPQTPLPASVSLAVPSGANLGWVGEIVGSDPSQDPTATYSIAAGQGYDVVTVTLTKARRGQIEIDVPAKATGTATTYSLSQPVLGSVAEASLSFQLPTGSTLSKKSSGLALEGSASGLDRYTLTAARPKPGSTMKASISAVVAPAAQAPPSGQQAPSTRQTPQGQAAGATGSSSASSSPWMTIAVIASFAFFAYNLYRYRHLKASEREAAVSQAAAHPPKPHGSKTPVKNSQAAARQDVGHAPVDDEVVANQLKTLGDKRSRGELSREEYLARKKQLLGGQRTGQLSRQATESNANPHSESSRIGLEASRTDAPGGSNVYQHQQEA